MQKYEKIIDNSYECLIFFRNRTPDVPAARFGRFRPFPQGFPAFRTEFSGP
jgi:hypothetical protein